MDVLLVLFALCLGVGFWIFLRHRVVFKMGVRNVPRRPAQTTLIVIGLMLSTLIIAAALTTGDTLNNSLTGTVYDLTGHVDEVVVQSSGAGSDTSAVNDSYYPQQAVAELDQKLAGNPDIAGTMPILAVPVPTINTRTELHEPSLMLTGIDPAKLDAFGGIKDVKGKAIDFGALPAGNVVISKTAADKLDAQPGDTLTVFAQNTQHKLTVAGVAPDQILTGMTDVGGDGGFVMPLAEAQQLTGRTGQLSLVAVANKGSVKESVKRSDAAVSALNSALEGSPYKAVPIKQSALETSELAGNIFTSVFMMLGLFSIAAGVLLIFLIFVLLAAERKPEMGMARAVGLKRRQLTQMFLAEGIAYDLVSALVGAGLGVLVAFVIATAMGSLVGDFFTIKPVATWRSLVIAYTLGVVVTFITIAVSSWRVSRLNIVAAIRDIPEPTRQRASNRWLIAGILGVIIGALLIWAGESTGQVFPLSIGVSLLPLSLAVALRRFGVPARPLYTVASLLVLFFWLAPESWNDAVFGKLSGGIEMFFVSGIMMVAAATMAIIWNAEILTGLVSLLGRTFSRWLPAVKTAVAYPSASKGRTGMTIAMFSLIVFSLVMMATMNANFTQIFTTDKAGAGWDISATQAPTNPIQNFPQTLADNGVDTSSIAATARVESAFSAQIRATGSDTWDDFRLNGMSADFVTNSDAPLQLRATGYADDQAVWNAVKSGQNLAVIDATAVPANGGFGSPSFQLPGLKPGAKTMEPTQVEVRNPATGTAETVTIIGVLDSKVSMFSGLFVMDSSFTKVFPEPSTISYYVQVKPDVDAKAEARTIESKLIAYGVQAQSIKEATEQASSLSQGFLYLIEGFMGLGLLVGIAALGVISFRAVVERRQQIGMLRAIGYQRAMVSASFLIESSMITLLGVGSGVILGLLLSYQLMSSPDVTGSTGSETSFVIPWLLILAFIVVSVGASLLMAYIPSRQASRVPIAEALRYE
ncbi:MAG TPA: FtsX-like permease family protein [Thermomicrobiaceae bacterium]|nr:FtsX-like permease family protein [Thermomicrobiaceae bacterium]